LEAGLIFHSNNINMPNYITKIKLQDAAEQDYDLLVTELKQRSFTAHGGAASEISRPAFSQLSAGHFIRKGNIIQEVIDDVLSAARRTGKKFTFTIIKDKN
jgi:hypothetical protein